MPPPLPPGANLTPSEQTILNTLSARQGTPTHVIDAMLPMTGHRSLIRLQLYGQVIAVPVTSPPGAMMHWYRVL
jgi:hypothetical protein